MWYPRLFEIFVDLLRHECGLMHSMANEKAAKAKLICGIRKQYTGKDKSRRKGNIDSKKNTERHKVRAFLMEGP